MGRRLSSEECANKGACEKHFEGIEWMLEDRLDVGRIEWMLERVRELMSEV